MLLVGVVLAACYVSARRAVLGDPIIDYDTSKSWFSHNSGADGRALEQSWSPHIFLHDEPPAIRYALASYSFFGDSARSNERAT
jgi:hypothetical protein